MSIEITMNMNMYTVVESKHTDVQEHEDES
jgi:hypothetical protein